MKDSIDHALVITTLLERDIARICASGNETQQGLAADCAEHRRQLANKLRHIQSLGETEATGSFAAYVDHHAGKFIPSTPEQSAELRKLAERSRKINATPLEKVDLGMDEIIAALENAESRDRYEASAKAGDFNDINEPDDDTYLRHAAVSDHAAMVKYQAKIRRNGWILAWIAAAGAGVILAGIKIWFTYFKP